MDFLNFLKTAPAKEAPRQISSQEPLPDEEPAGSRAEVLQKTEILKPGVMFTLDGRVYRVKKVHRSSITIKRVR